MRNDSSTCGLPCGIGPSYWHVGRGRVGEGRIWAARMHIGQSNAAIRLSLVQVLLWFGPEPDLKLCEAKRRCGMDSEDGEVGTPMACLLTYKAACRLHQISLCVYIGHYTVYTMRYTT